MSKLTELKDKSNAAILDSMSKEEQYAWYLRIKASLPLLKTIGETGELESAIIEYEHEENIK